MTIEREPHEIIAELSTQYLQSTNAEILQKLQSLPPLADEEDAIWDDDSYWMEIAYPYLALARAARERKLQDAIIPFLERACYGDPGEIMRGLRHSLEGIVNPNWDVLADKCLQTVSHERPGTRLWSLKELAVLDDPRARPYFEVAINSEFEEIRCAGESGLDR